MGLWWKKIVPGNKTKKEPGRHSSQLQPQFSDGASESSNPNSQSSLPSNVTRQPGTVNVDFRTNGSLDHKKKTQLPTSNNPVTLQHSHASQEGFLGPTGVYVPSTGFRTPSLATKMKEKYGIPEEEIQKAIDFAESEDFVDVFCFTYCITGGPMEPTAFKIAGLQGMEKDAIVESAGAPGTEGLRALTPEEQKRRDKARNEFLVERALVEEDGDEPQPEDLEELSEAYRERFEEDTVDMSLEEVMTYFGVPDASRVAIHRTLHPSRGVATASQDEKARRKAAHAVALERFDEMS